MRGFLPLILIIIAPAPTSLVKGDELPAVGLIPIPEPRGFGEPCSCDSDCALGKWLKCHGGQCLCVSDTFEFDHSRETCVVKLGEKCFEIAGDGYHHLPPLIRCVEGAFCSISAGGLCACNAYGYYESSDGKECLMKKEFGQSCEHALECSSDACSEIERRCECKEGQFFDSGREKCMGAVGTFCFSDDDCTHFAVCSSSAKCECGPGYFSTSDLLCAQKLRQGDSCSTTTPCNNPSLSCVDNLCSCRYPGEQVLDQESRECRIFVASAPCFDDESCVPDAHCHRPSHDFSECRCPFDKVEGADGHCHFYKGHESSCSSSSECDPTVPLICKDFLCQCADSLTKFDQTRRACRGLHGFRGCKDDKDCVEFANCVHFNDNLPKKCLCSNNGRRTADRTCIPN